MRLTIETDELKITLSVGPEGVTIDAPSTDGVGDETSTQTTLTEARWEAYARGRADERQHRRELDDGRCSRCDNHDAGESEICDECFDELRYEDFEEVENGNVLLDRLFGEITEPTPPAVDPITGNISEHVKSYRLLRRERAPEANERQVYHSSCCGTPNAAMREGSCKGCR